MLSLTHQQDNFPIDTRFHRSKNFVCSEVDAALSPHVEW